jgi:hypothetical protein
MAIADKEFAFLADEVDKGSVPEFVPEKAAWCNFVSAHGVCSTASEVQGLLRSFVPASVGHVFTCNFTFRALNLDSNRKAWCVKNLGIALCHGLCLGGRCKSAETRESNQGSPDREFKDADDGFGMHCCETRVIYKMGACDA